MTGRRLAVGAGACALALSVLVSAALASSGAPIRFHSWVVRTDVNGAPHDAVTRQTTYWHCQNQPVTRLTANFRATDVPAGSKLRATWYYRGAEFFSFAVRRNPGGGPRVFFYVQTGNSTGYPDSGYEVRIKINGQPAASRTIRLKSLRCG